VANTPAVPSPIADLTYRSYDGPLYAPAYRWWPIAKMSMRLSIKKKGFWGWAIMSGWWYIILAAIFYFADAFSQNIGGPKAFFSGVVWKDQFLDGFSRAQLFYLILALLMGVGAIANDNRANALLVYLSKPCTKTDYLIGKWFGIFIPLACVVAAPTLLFYGYCAMSYRSYGFISQDPWLILKLLAIVPIPAAFHASVALGISSLFNQGRLAGAVYSGIYFMTSFITVALGVARTVAMSQHREASKLVETFFYFAVDGIQIALAKMVLGTPGSVLFANVNRRQPAPPGIPSVPLFVALYFGICFLALGVAWSRIRAVEVVGS
jgi:ABC-2 type transport system permease protein